MWVRAALTIVLGAVAVVAVGWAAIALFGLGFAFAWTVHFAMMAWMAASLDAARPALRGSWFRVRPWEPRVHRLLGVWWYARLLRRVGWERAMGRAGAFDGRRSSLVALERRTRSSELGHAILAAVGAVLAAVAATLGAWSAAAWLLVLDVALHAYPVALQRALRARIGRLLRHRPAPR